MIPIIGLLLFSLMQLINKQFIMKKFISVLIILILSALTAYSQSAHSDSLFAIGVDLYNSGKYKEAIQLFSKCDKLDQEELDSTSNRRSYSAMWLASCYYQLGDTTLSKETSPYYYYKHPVDRRLTIKSDSLSNIQTEDLIEELANEIKAAEIEKANLGDSNEWYGNSLINILSTYYQLGEAEEIINLIPQFEKIITANSYWGYDHLGILMMFYSIIFDTQADNLINQIKISSFLYKETEKYRNVPYGEYPDGVFGDAATLYMRALINNDQLETAINIGEKNRKEMSKVPSLYNANRYKILSSLGTLYGGGNLNNGSKLNNTFPFETASKRWPIYEENEEVIKHTFGVDSYEWAALQVKKSNFYIMHNENRDLEKTKEYIHKAFDNYTNKERNSSERDLYLDMLYQQSSLFGIIGDDQSYIDYVYTILSPDTIVRYNNKEIWSSIASKLWSHKINRRGDAINIYSMLYKDAILHNDSSYAISTLKDKAFSEYLDHKYEDAVNDYHALNSLIDKFLVNTSLYSLSDHANIYHNLATCYNQSNLNDSTLFNKFRDIAIEKKEKAILSNNNNNENYNILNVYDDYKSIGDWIEESYSGFDRQKFPKSIDYYKKSAEILQSISNEQGIQSQIKNELASLYNRIAMRYTYIYDFNNADTYLRKVLSLCPDSLNYNYINAINGYARLYDLVSIEPELSLNYYYRHITLSEERFRKMSKSLLPGEILTETERLIKNWEKCAEKFEYLGNNEEALRCLDRMLELLKEQDSEYYSLEKLNRLEKELMMCSPSATQIRVAGGEYFRIEQKQSGDFERSKKLADEIVSFYEDNFTPIPAEGYLNLYYCYNNFTNDSITAHKYLQKTIDALKQEHPSDYMFNENYCDLLRDLARKKGGTNELQYYLNQKNLFSSSPQRKKEYVLNLGYIASQYSKLNMADSAFYYSKLYIEEAKGLDRKIEDEAIAKFAEITERFNRLDLIVPYYDSYLKIIKTYLLENFKFETSEERERSWSKYENIPFSCAEMLNKVYNANIPDTTLYNNILFRKGILLNTSISSANLILAQGDSLLLQKYNRMLRLKKKMDTNSQMISDNGKTMTYEQAYKIVTRFDSEIMERASMLGDYTSTLTCSWKDVQLSLNNGEIAVEFTKYPISDSKEQYAALILKPTGMPEYIELFTSDSLNLKNIYESSLIYNLIWLPIIKKTGNVKQIFFSADGTLHNIAIEYVPWEDQTNIIKPVLTRLSSTRVLTTKHTPLKIKDAIVYGGIQYDTSTDVLVSDSRKYQSANRSLDDYLIADSLNLRGGVAYLPATKIEANEIHSSLGKKAITVTVLTDTLATEGTFKFLSGKKTDILHIATHGFYWTEKEAMFRNDLRFIKGSSQAKSVEDKSLTRSGLLFAGANNALTGKKIPDGVDDGIVTAKEISQLDLRGLDLVVLSACQTGLGEIKGDGVFGLQRGFKKAGAQSLLMSLWKVDDNATQLLMTQFYKNLTSGMSKFESLRQAQDYLRNYEVDVELKADTRPSVSAHAKEKMRQSKDKEITYKKIRKYDDPYYWAAFILLDAIN